MNNQQAGQFSEMSDVNNFIYFLVCRYYRDWTREIVASSNNNVLQFDVSTGWEPLCHYLQRDAPTVNFPR